MVVLMKTIPRSNLDNHALAEAGDDVCKPPWQVSGQRRQEAFLVAAFGVISLFDINPRILVLAAET